MNWIDFAISGTIFLAFIVVVLILTINYFSNKIYEIRSNEISKASESYLSKITDQGVNDEWDLRNQTPVSFGLGRDVYFIPILVNSTTNKRSYDVLSIDLNFDYYCSKKINISSIRVLNQTFNEVNYTLINKNFCDDGIKNSTIVFYDKPGSEKKYFVYFSREPLIERNYTLDYNMSLYFDFDRAESNIIMDKTENGNDGFLTSGFLDYGKFGYSVNFNKLGIINISENKNLNSSIISLDFWVKINEYDDSKIIEKANSYGLKLGPVGQNNRIIGYIEGLPENYQPYTPILNLDEWYHIVFTSDGHVHSIYLNGNLVNSTNYDISLPTQESSMSLGGDYNQNYLFNGSIDELRVYRHVITSQDVLNSNSSAPNQITVFPEMNDVIISFNKMKSLKNLDYDFVKKTFGDKYNFRIEVYKN
ncbi:MAG: LamG domain-containing protein [Candidatus Aenigmatarchaeota archaeon]|nr:LamG domain-containing protein [Candidatus Aenigmarchaeota archaeon]